MTKHQYTRMRAAAEELLRLHALGSPVDAAVLAWATEVCAPTVIPKIARRSSPVQDRLQDILIEHQATGATAAKCAELTSWPLNTVSSTLGYMCRIERAYCIKLPNRSRYFPTSVTMEAAREQVQLADAINHPKPEKRKYHKRTAARAERVATAKKATEERRLARHLEREALRAKRAAEQDIVRKAKAEAKREAWATRNKPKPKSHQTMQVKAKVQPNVVIPAARKPSIHESVFVPAHVVKQVIPTPEDTRYKADPNGDGAGFMADWRAKRGQP